jgi:hypothetical protein
METSENVTVSLWTDGMGILTYHSFSRRLRYFYSPRQPRIGSVCRFRSLSAVSLLFHAIPVELHKFIRDIFYLGPLALVDAQEMSFYVFHCIQDIVTAIFVSFESFKHL